MNYLTLIFINLFWCCEKVFINTNTWMIRKNSMKHHDLKRGFLQLQIFTKYYYKHMIRVLKLSKLKYQSEWNDLCIKSDKLCYLMHLKKYVSENM